MITVPLELFGFAEKVIGKRRLTLHMAEGSTLADLVELLAGEYPALVGQVISADRTRLLEPHLFSINGRQMVPDLRYPLRDQEALVLLLIPAGGSL